MADGKAKKYKPESAKQIFHRFVVSEESGNEWRSYCPVCEDPATSGSPSASFNFEKNVWHCMGKCSQGGSIWSLAQDLAKNKNFNIRSEMMTGRKNAAGGETPLMTFNAQRGATPALDEQKVVSWHKKLFASQAFMQQIIDERGFSEETLRELQIGWDGQRYTIPVRDVDNALVNVRKYKMNAGPKGDKMLNITGHGAARIYRPDVLKANDVIVITEGETDCILLNQIGIPACTHTAGAATFKAEWGPLFAGKTVYICYDNDDVGRAGMIKAGKAISAYADQIYQIDIPLPDKGADITDFLHKEGRTEVDFKELMANAKPMNPTKVIQAEESPNKGRAVDLEESMSEELQSEVLEMTITVAGKRNPPFDVPKRFTVNCNFNKGTICQDCPVMFSDGQLNVEINQHDKALVKFIDIPEDKHPRLLKEVSGALCTSNSEFTVEETYNMEELTISNSVDSRKSFEDQTPTTRDVYSVSTHSTPVNSVSRIVGKNATNPRNSRKTFLAWHVDSVKTSLDKFELTTEMRDEMYVFQQSDNPDSSPQSPLDKCIEIAQDLSYNVTRIYDRDILHVAYDLVWHSPLAFEVEGQMIDKGWLEMMVVGDTRTGKSETAMRLSDHYNAGIVKSCEGATFAGLVGGVQQTNSGSWMTTWGVIPLNDRRLVVLDEVSGLKDKDVIENMSSIRSMGRAQITKINTQETSARTRLIWITNPADGMMIEERPDVGVGALKTVVKNQEDIARFDFVVAARASEVSAKIINEKHSDKMSTIYSSDLCSQLVLWAWSLKPEQIEFTASAVSEARRIASAIGEEYVADPPLIQAENVRFKLYRIAAALAARTFSIRWPKKGEMKLTVTKDHIQDAKRFLDLIYDNPGMEYRSSSRTVIAARARAKKNKHVAKMWIIENSDTVLVTLRAVSQDSRWKGRDFEEFGGMTKDDAALAVKRLQQWGMIQRKPQGYIVMDKMLVAILRELEREDY